MSTFYDLDPNAQAAKTLSALAEGINSHDMKILAKILVVNTGYLIEIWKELEQIRKHLIFENTGKDG